MMDRRCKDCLVDGVKTSRPAPHPGPRCRTHHLAVRRQRRDRAHELRTQSGYGITATDYADMYAAQGGCCAICQRATGKTRRLAVDHEHHRSGCQHPSKQGCRRCVRGLLCSTCNRILIGRYDTAALRRAIAYLKRPPAQEVLLAQ